MMKKEYDFKNMKNGVKGKYAESYRAGHTVTIHKEDGSIVVQNFKLEDGAVLLDADVQKYFPDSEAVNNALRCLIPILQNQQTLKTN